MNKISSQDEIDEDPIERTGCAHLNDTVLECWHENGKDWRKCQKELKAFKECLDQYYAKMNKNQRSLI